MMSRAAPLTAAARGREVPGVVVRRCRCSAVFVLGRVSALPRWREDEEEEKGWKKEEKGKGRRKGREGMTVSCFLRGDA